jgi:regulator of sigma E protease
MDFLQVVWSIFLIVAFFGGSIFVHEFGHYLAARKRGLKVERFSIGFGPKLWSTKRDGVEWCVCVFPLGGYVALPQLADLEGIEGKYEGEKLPPISYTDTLIVAVMGVVFNMLFAFALGCILWGVGRPVPADQNTTTIGTVLTLLDFEKGPSLPGPGVAAGLKPMDNLLEIDGVPVKNWRDVKQMIVTGVERDSAHLPQCTLKVERAGKVLELKATPVLYGDEHLRSLGILPFERLLVEKVDKNSPAESVGIQAGDEIIAFGEKPLYDFYDFQTALEANKDAPTSLIYRRAGKEISLPITPKIVKISRKGETTPSIGVEFKMETVIIHQNPFEQITDAAVLTWRTLTTLVNPSSDIKLTHLSGPPGIAWMIYRLSDDLRRLLYFIIIINVNLAILNLLPLPVLDGGQIVVATINKLRGKNLPVQTVIVLQNIFAVVLLVLMVYVMCFADLPRVHRQWKEQQAYKAQLRDAIEPVFETPHTLSEGSL